MSWWASLLFVALPMVAVAFRPQVTLSVAPEEVVLTESAEATVSIFTQRRFQHSPRLSADFIPQGERLSMSCEQSSLNGTNAWLYTVKVPVRAEAAGKMSIGPVVVSIPVRTDMFGLISRTADYRSGLASLKVIAPPERDRPASYCGALSKGFRATATIDTNVCMVGDPLLLTLEMEGATDFSMVYAPSSLESTFRGTPFRIDLASCKTETVADSKRFVWRVRAMSAGTVEFPPIEVSFFDIASRSYRTVRTTPIPVQVKAGAQVALETVDDDGHDDFPVPDGLEIPFEVRNFTLRHAMSLACKAVSEAEFAAAADRYAAFVEMLDCDEGRTMRYDWGFRSTHLSNLGALYAMSGRPKDALAAYARAERISGATSATERGIRASIARLKNDPRAELPLQRIVFPFWYRLSLYGRVVFSMCAFLVVVALFWVAMRAGRRLSVLALAFGLAHVSQASLFGRNPFSSFFDDMPSMRTMRESPCPIRATAEFESKEVMVGEPVNLVVTVTPGSVKIDPMSIRIAAEVSGESVSGKFTSDVRGVFKMPVTFVEAATNGAEVVVSGVYSGSYCVTNGNMISSGRVMNQPFKIDLNATDVVVRPLPMEGRPAEFSGAIGRSFKISERVSPSKVHPGDLVTVEYRLYFDGYCPSNASVRVSDVADRFKAYGVQEVSRSGNSVVWRQMLVPYTADAINSPSASFSYFNVLTKRYERVVAKSERIHYVSSEVASTENTKVAVDIVPTAAINDAGDSTIAQSLTLRFAPSEKSPVVVVLPPDEKVQETGRYGVWRRMESSKGSGWTK